MNEVTFMIDGTKEDAVLALYNQGLGVQEDAKRLLNYLEENRFFLTEEEAIESNREAADLRGMSLTLIDDTYYINVKISTIVITALLLDIALTKGFAAAALSLCGAPTAALARLDEYEGEKCIVKETLIQKNRDGDGKLLSRYRGKCRLPLAHCKFRNGEDCRCTPQNVIEIYDQLCVKNIVKKDSERLTYQYQW